jgi:hypothetical protein
MTDETENKRLAEYPNWVKLVLSETKRLSRRPRKATAEAKQH